MSRRPRFANYIRWSALPWPLWLRLWAVRRIDRWLEVGR